MEPHKYIKVSFAWEHDMPDSELKAVSAADS